MENNIYKYRTIEEYNNLVKKFRKNEPSAIKELYKEGIWWSILVSQKYVEISQPLENVVIVAFSGWLKAIEHYQLGKNYKLSTYATWWIRNEICKAFNILP